VPGERLRLEAYTRIAAIDTDADAAAVAEELEDRFGTPPEPVRNLLAVAVLRARARRAGLTDITLQGSHIRFAPVQLPESRQVRVERLYPRTVLKPGVRTMLVPVPKAGDGPRPSSAGGRSGSGRSGPGSPVSIGAPPLRDTELLAWCDDLIEQVLGGLPPAGQEA
jgi:transcription-repair coupling factor (superfamily II helicase)